MKFVTLFLTFLSSVLFANAPTKKNEILEYAFYHLEETGILKQDSHGFVYVDVNDNYIYKLIDLIKLDGFEIPPYFGWNGHGAHISVITATEATKKEIELEEHGAKVFFRIKDCQIVFPERDDLEAVCILTVEAPNLDKIRQKYGLKKFTFEYHITIGFKRSQRAA